MTNARRSVAGRIMAFVDFIGGWRRILLSLIAVLLAGAVFSAGVIIKRKSPFPRPMLRAPEIQFVEPEEEIDLDDLGTFVKWSKVEILMHGPHTSVMNRQNPFEIAVEVTFRGPDDQEYTVPAFYDGDGEGSETGNVWKARFSPDAAGRWTFSSESTDTSLAGYYGSFTVEEPEACEPYEPGGLPDFYCVGRLQYEAGSHYLRFADGGYWVKGGIDDPENLLGEALGDWPEKRDAIDFLREQGTNSVYFMTNNITPGDRNDTWPWVGENSDEVKKNTDRFDVVKLQAWEDFFEYVQQQGIVLHFILADDSAWVEFDHYLYYREMIARFGHHPGLIWNIGEEADESYWESDQRELAEALREMDPFGHPVTVHRKPHWPFIGETFFDLTSIQAGDGAGAYEAVLDFDINEIVGEHRQASVDAGHPIPIMVDETPNVLAVNDETQFIMRSEILYPVYLGGGSFELHYRDAHGQGGSLTIYDMAPMLQDMLYARTLVESVPFVDMAPCNQLLGDVPGNFCLGEAGEVYVLYTASGEPLRVDLSAMEGQVWLQWYDPTTGAFFDEEPIEAGPTVQLAPPGGREMAAVIRGVTP